MIRLGIAALKSLGKAKSKLKTPKPKFTADDFVKDVKVLEQKLAEKFLLFVKEELSNKKINFESLNGVLLTEQPIDETTFEMGITQTGNKFFIKKGKAEQQFTFVELWWLLEKGRKDKDLLPNPILYPAFVKFKKVYKASIRHLLTKK